MGCHFLIQERVPTQGRNLCLLHWQVDSLLPNHWGSPTSYCGTAKDKVVIKQGSSPKAAYNLVEDKDINWRREW